MDAVHVVDVHGNGGDIDSLLSTDGEAGGGGAVDRGRRLGEPYERHRAHDLRAECYRRGLRPIKKGPQANDNKGGYILLLRRYDGSAGGEDGAEESKQEQGEEDDEGDEDAQELDKKRKLAVMSQVMVGDGSTSAGTDLQGFYEATQSPALVSVLPMQYTALTSTAPTTTPQTNVTAAAAPKPAGNATTDLEILSGIANSYTQSAASDAQLCGNCRTVVLDELFQSVRLGKTREQLNEWHKFGDQRDRDTRHLKDVIAVIGELRKAFREAQAEGINHGLLVELEDDLSFFQELKERAKDRMRRAMQMQDAQTRPGNKGNATA